MRHLLLISLLAGFGATSAFAHDGHEKQEKSEKHEKSEKQEKQPIAPPVPVATTAEGSIYGATWPAEAQSISLDEAAAQVDALKDQPRAISGRITEVCQKMGCWLALTSEKGQVARVFMHGHAYSVPKDASDDAVVYGTITEKVVAEKEAKHLVDDGAKAPAERELRIDAHSVLIRSGS